MSYLFSIIIPVFNSEKFISSTLESVLKQNFANIEVILINDNSTDNTLKICKNYKKKYKNIKLINKSVNLGVGSSRNEGIKNALGKYLIFVG